MASEIFVEPVAHHLQMTAQQEAQFQPGAIGTALQFQPSDSLAMYHELLASNSNSELDRKHPFALEARTSALEALVSTLEASYERKSKIALRALVTEAKKLDQGIFNQQELAYLRDNATKKVVSTAAYVVHPSRIKEAIQRTKSETLLMGIFRKVYPDEKTTWTSMNECP